MKRLFLVLALLLFTMPAFAASTFTADQADDYNLSQHSTGIATTVTSTYEVATALVINDVIQMVKVPKNSTIIDCILVTDDLDTGTTIVLDVGYGTNDDYFILGSTVGQEGGLVRASAATAFPLVLTADDTVDLHVDTAPTGGGVGTVTLSVTYIFTP